MYQAKSLFFFAILLCFTIEISAQTIFKEGYIVRENGDYVEGFISYSAGRKIPEKCIFKRFDIATTVTYSAEMLKSFGYRNGRRFESSNVDGENVFYETIVSGKISLLKSKSGYYIRKEGFDLLDLKSKEVKWEDENGEKIFKNSQELLNFLAGESRAVDNDKKDIESDLIAAIISYNTRMGSDFIAYKTDNKDKGAARVTQFGAGQKSKGIIAGINQYSLHLASKDGGYYPMPERERGYTFGVTYEKVISRRNDRLSLRTDVLFLKQTFYSYNKEILPRSIISTDDAFFDFSALRLPFLLQYSLSGSNYRPFLNLGLTGSWFMQRNYLHINERQSTYDKSIFTTVSKDLEIRNIEMSFCAGGGIKFKIAENLHLNVEARVEVGSGLFKIPEDEKLTVSQYSIQSGIFTAITF